MFSSGSPSSISLATVTPSLVIVGEPNFFSMTTLRPLGPSVTFTASASLLTPRRIAARASPEYVICLAMLFLCLLDPDLSDVGEELLVDDSEDLVLAEDHVVLTVDLDLAAGVLAHQHPVARLDVHRRTLALVGQLARTDGHHFSLLRLLLGGVGDDDASPHLLLLLNALDDDTIVQGTDVHSGHLLMKVTPTLRLCLRPARQSRVVSTHARRLLTV